MLIIIKKYTQLLELSKGNKEISGKILYCISMLFYVLNDSFLKFLSPILTSGPLIFLRALFSIIIVILIGIFTKTNFFYLKSYKIMTLRCIFSFATLTLSIKALEGITLQIYNIYYHLSPLFAVFLAIWILKEKVNNKIFIAVAIGFFGVAISFHSDAGGDNIYKVYALLASLCWACSITTLKKLSGDDKPMTILFYSCLFNLILTSPSITNLNLCFTTCFYVLLLSVIHLSAFYLIIVALQRVPLYQAAPLEYTGIIWAFTIGYFVWNETPDLKMLIGSSLIILSSYYTIKLKR